MQLIIFKDMYFSYGQWHVFLQNENVNREITSTHRVHDLRCPDRRTAMKILVAKTFTLVPALWQDYLAKYVSDLM